MHATCSRCFRSVGQQGPNDPCRQCQELEAKPTCCDGMRRGLDPRGQLRIEWRRIMQPARTNTRMAHVIVTWPGDEQAVWIITHCPWCGAKLEVLQ